MDQVSHLSPLIPSNTQVEKIQEIKPTPDSSKGQKKNVETGKGKKKSPAQMNPLGKIPRSKGDPGRKVDIFV